LNAVLVRDVAARMPLYEELIAMLDVPTKAIEITAAIVDIDADNGRQVGFELLGFGKNGNDIFRLGFDADRGQFDGTNTQGQIPSFLEGSNLARGAGLNATALIGGAGYNLLTRLRAIEEVGAGQIVSSPSVLTMENVQAVIRTDEKVYVRVEGNMEVDLFDVTTGVQLRVTPTIVKTGERQDYRLQIDIKDGSFVDKTVDNIPATRESAINTQAIVPESKTLLLGGYFVERRARNTRQVPLLSKIPVLGKVFSRNEKDHDRTQRFFFITPRLVDIGKEATAPANYGSPDENELALPSRLAPEELSRDRAEDLARRLAAGNSNTPWVEDDGKRPNALLPPAAPKSPIVVPKATPYQEEVRPAAPARPYSYPRR
jgi:type III secretion protein C